MDDRELSRVFRELRRQDEASAPSFRELLKRTQVRPRRSRKFRALTVAASAALLVLAAIIFLAHRPSPEPRFEGHVALADWKSPTDSLLRTPGAQLLDSIPSIVRPAPDYSGIGRGKAGPTPSERNPKS